MNRRTVIVGGVAGGLVRLAAGCAPPAVDFAPTLFEWRGYRAQPGRRDELVGMFEDVFLDAYQSGGARIVSTFRSLDDPSRWVWMRAFADAPARGPALRSFYGGDVWKRHADACNATIADIDEAMLLREVHPGALASACAPPKGTARPASVVLVEVYPIAREREESFAVFHERELQPRLEQASARVVATLLSDHAGNSYPRQPVRAGSVFVAISRFDSAAASGAWIAASRSPPKEWLTAAVERERLAPCGRSGLS